MTLSNERFLARLKRRLWMKYALRGVSGNDNHARLDMAYSVADPWNMDSELERARFEATNRIIASAFGTVGSVLEIGCGEAHQTQYLAKVSDRQYGVDVSGKAVARAQARMPDAEFAIGDGLTNPWADVQPRFDLVTACEVLYYASAPDLVIRHMRSVARAGLVTFFSPAAGRIARHLEHVPEVQRDWIHHRDTTWLVAWWINRDEAPPR